ncbi:hypothetical protein [Nocardia jiangsuensis]|uniref:DUF732 domain-containing protein n=1 Tax=Nocardia jiangsuensis TaxID=1691563 RepID=A0ABV8DWT3_9NOCA
MGRVVGAYLFILTIAAAAFGTSGCDSSDTSTAPPSATSANTGTTTTARSTVAASTTTVAAAPVPPGDLTAMPCTQFLELDDATQKSTLPALAAQLGYPTRVNPSNFRIVQTLCRNDPSKLVKDWLGRE